MAAKDPPNRTRCVQPEGVLRRHDLRFEEKLLRLRMTVEGDMQFIAESIIRTTPERLFAFHELPDALPRLTPPWEHSRVLQAPPSLRPGSRAIVEIRVAPLVWIRTESVHTVYEPPSLFVDELVKGPFRRWHHRHVIAPHPDGALLTDAVDFEPPLPPFGRWLAPWTILPRLRRLFAYRHEVTRAWCETGAASISLR